MLLKKLILLLPVLLLVPDILVSCGTSRRAAVKCPEFLAKKNHKITSTYRWNKFRRLGIQQRARGRKQPISYLQVIHVQNMYNVLKVYSYDQNIIV